MDLSVSDKDDEDKTEMRNFFASSAIRVYAERQRRRRQKGLTTYDGVHLAVSVMRWRLISSNSECVIEKIGYEISVTTRILYLSHFSLVMTLSAT